MTRKKKLFLITVFVLLFQTGLTQAFAKIDLSFSVPPSEIKTDESFTLDINVSGADQNADYYIRGVFFKPDTSQYFGFTQNNSASWQADSGNTSSFFKVTGNGTHSVTFKPDANSPYFATNTNYLFKVGRYTPAGSLTWSEQTPSVVLIKAVEPTPIASVSSTPSMTATISATPTLALTTTPFPSSTPSSTPTPTPNVDPFAISLSEIMGCPIDNQGEWIELYNKTGTTISLQHWKLKDSTETHIIDVSNTIQPYGYLIIRPSSSLLNNAGDSVRLFTDQNLLVDQMSYTHCEDGTSIIFVNGIWQMTQTVTQGSSNIFTPITNSIESITPPVETSIPNQDSADQLVATPSEYPGTGENKQNDEFFQDIPIASIESKLELPPKEQNVSNPPSTEAASPTPLISTSAAFLLGGICYILSAAMLAQKWYNLTSYAVSSLSSTT